MSTARTTRAGTRYSPVPPRNNKGKIKETSPKTKLQEEQQARMNAKLKQQLQEQQEEKARLAQIQAEKEAAKTLSDLENEIIEETFASKESASSSSASAKIAASNANGAEDVPMADRENDDDYTVITKPTNFVAVAPATYFGGTSARIKKRILDKLIQGKVPNYTGAAPTFYTHHKIDYVQVYFANADALKACLHAEFTNKDNQSFHFQPINDIKPTISAEDQLRRDACTIQVINIPLNVTTPVIRRTFAQFGTIVALRTRTRDLYQQAFIQFESPDSVQPFYDDIWDVLLLRDTVRVLPISLNDAKRALRRQFSIKLAGLPRGTTAFDLQEILKAVNAKSCFIPRTMNNYAYTHYAYINFANEADVFEAAKKAFHFNDYELYWVATDTYTCHACGSPEHMVAECPNKPNRTMTPKQQKLNKLYDRYRPAQHRKPARSYADAANPNRGQPLAQSLSQNEKSELIAALSDIREKLTTMNDKINSLAKRIDTLESSFNNNDKPPVASPIKTQSNTATHNKFKSPPAKRARQDVSTSSDDSDSDSTLQAQFKSLQEENKLQGQEVASLRSQLDTITHLLQTKIDNSGYRTEDVPFTQS